MKRILIDSDAGADDLLAIKLATQTNNLDVLCIIASYGDFSQIQSKKRIKKILNYTKKKNSLIINGSSKPIKNKFNISINEILNKTSFEKNKLIEIIKKNTIDVYVSLGPLTNLAKIIQDKTFKRKIKKIVIMGGNLLHQGNYTPFSEVNFYSDPYAVEKVFNANQEIFLFPLDITENIQITKKQLFKFFSNEINNSIFLPYFNFYKNFKYHNLSANFLTPIKYKGAAIHDCLPIIYLINEKIFQFKKIEVFTDKIINEKGCIYPRLRDYYVNFPKKSKVINVATSVNEKEFWNTFDSLMNLV